MDSYKFTYKDVIKRHERMINRVEQWEIQVLAIIMLIVTAFFTFSTFCYATDSEEVRGVEVSNLYMPFDANYFASDSRHRVFYLELEKGYSYSFNNNGSYNVNISFSNSIPAPNVTFYEFKSIGPNSSYSFISDDYDYVYFDYQDFNIVITKTKLQGQSSTVSDLVENVGINQIWDIFGSGVNFVYVVIVVAFGIFLIALAIRKVSKGKSEF